MKSISMDSCLPYFSSVASLALGQPYDWHCATEVTLQNIGNIDCFQNKTKHDKHEHCKCNFWYVQWAFSLGLAHGKLPSWYRCKHMRNMLCTHNETYHIIDMRDDPRGNFSTKKDAPKVSQNLKALWLVFGVTNTYQIGVPLQVLNERIH